MKIKLNINNKIRKENERKKDEEKINKLKRNGNKEEVKEYRFDTESMSAKLTASKDNVLKLEFGEKRKRAGYVEKKKGTVIKKYVNNFFKNENKLPKNYYRLFIAMTILALASTVLVIKNYRLTDLEDFLTYSLDGNEDVIQASSSIDTKDIANEAVLEQKIEQSNNNIVVTNPAKKEVVEKLVFTKPMDGEISKIFSNDKVIYSKTLELWKTHDGIDIKGEIGKNVSSIEKGKIDKVYNDSFLGYTVVIDHGQGYKSSYSNLSENVPVKVGEIVIKGQIIGQISNTAIGEIKDEPHLHFMLIKDGAVIDPTYIIKN